MVIFWFSRLQLLFLLVTYMFLGTVKIPQEFGDNFNDLVMHAIGYGVLMISGIFAYPRREYFIALMLVFLGYSFMIECIQYFLSYRSFSWLDMAANGLGLFIGTGLRLVLLPLIKKVRVDLEF